jgi:osmotically-inducible protein OsmY
MDVNSATFTPEKEQSVDELLARRVRNFVTSNRIPGSATLRVDADSGVVTLGGHVGSFYQKQLWIHGTQRVAGVIRVVDQIEVQQPHS